MDLSQITTLEELRAAVQAFEGCSLKKNAKNTVFSDGSPLARVMLIGEAPGAQEDEMGKPFVGRSGQLLDKMMNYIGFDRRNNGENGVYITNTVFWRPPENRTPTPAETMSCRPFLLKHIALVKPEIIVLVGGTAVKSVLQTTEGIGIYRKRWLQFEVPGLEAPIDMMATFHPAYLLRNPPAKAEARADLQMLRQKAQELGFAPPVFPETHF